MGVPGAGARSVKNPGGLRATGAGATTETLDQQNIRDPEVQDQID